MLTTDDSTTSKTIEGTRERLNNEGNTIRLRTKSNQLRVKAIRCIIRFLIRRIKNNCVFEFEAFNSGVDCLPRKIIKRVAQVQKCDKEEEEGKLSLITKQ